MCIGNYKQLQKLAAGWKFDRLALQFARLLTAPPRFDQLMVTDDFRNTVVDGTCILKKSARRRICKLDQPPRIGDQHAVG